MKLSIITVNFNNRDGLQRTIDSVVCQTWCDFEWIIIDGGSTDGSKELIEQYQAHFAYWCSEPDKGIYNAMNKGIDKAKGEYLIFMNSGDCFYEADTLKKVAEVHPKADIVYGDFTQGGKKQMPFKKDILLQLYEQTICHQATFIRHRLFEKRRYDEKELKIVSDWKFWLETIVLDNASVEHIDILVADQEVIGTSTYSLALMNERTKVLHELFPPRVLESLDLLHWHDTNRPMLRTRLLIERGGWAERLTRSVLKLLDRLFLKIDFRANGYVCQIQKKEKRHSPFYDRIRNAFFHYIANPLAYRYTARYHIMDSMESIRYVIDHRCSLSRYGDGEFKVMMGQGNGFQTPNPRLSAMLRHVILADDAPNHIVGLPLNMQKTDHLIDGYPPFFWRYFTGRHIWFLRRFFRKERTYLNTQMTRFFYEVRDKSHCAEHIALLKQIWDQRDVVIVEGAQTRSGVGNDLYRNARSVKRILGPATDAIDRYDELLKAVTTYVPKDRLVLLSLGMTATVMAYDLAKLGYQAIDLGHLDIEYEWYLRGDTHMDKPVAVEGKFTNEAVGGGIL